MEVNDDDLTVVRNILHLNSSVCLLIAHGLFLFGMSEIAFKVILKLLGWNSD